MKTNQCIPGALAILAVSALAVPASLAAPKANSADTNPIIPVGAMTASPKVVQTGTHPTLSWSIVYPSKVSDVCTITPPGTITLTQQVYVDVRPVGVGVTDCTAGADMDEIPAEARMSINGSDFAQLFYGTNDDVDPSHSLFTKKLSKGTVIDFGGRYVKNGAWTSFFTTRSSNAQVIALADGDAIPTTFDLVSSGKINEFLKPYVDGAGKVDIGPMSLLILAEYGATDHSSPCFNYQDMALLVSFAYKNNNGHGNNIDGVDVSNPGKGSGGPNGAVDPSGGVDDERK